MTRDEVIALARDAGLAYEKGGELYCAFKAGVAITIEIESLAAAIEARVRQDDPALRLVADIRFALGDDGKRMQGELLDYCKELRKDAERYYKLRAECLAPDDEEMPIEIAMRKMLICVREQRGDDAFPTTAEFDLAIDAAMQTQAPDGA